MTFVSVGCGLLLECFPVPKQKTFMGSGAYRERWRERERESCDEQIVCLYIYFYRERERDGTALLQRNVMIVVFARYMYCIIYVQFGEPFSILISLLVYWCLS